MPSTRPKRPPAHRPSPLKQVQHTRILSVEGGDLSIVRDPEFWKRFSIAAHAAEDMEKAGPGSPASSKWTVDVKTREEDDWLQQQRQKKRRCCYIGWAIVLLVLVLAAAIGIVVWWFTNGRKM